MTFLKNQVMRCMGLLLVAVFSFAAPNKAANLNNLTHATPQIAQYVQKHFATIKQVKQMQFTVSEKLNQLGELSTSQIEEKISEAEPSKMLLPSIYPVQTSALTPGPVRTRQINVDLPTPLFLVGDDDRSKRWLTQYKIRLMRLKARGFVVNVETQQAMLNLQKQFAPLQMMAMPGNALAKWLNVKHYPVLLSDHLIEQ